MDILKYNNINSSQKELIISKGAKNIASNITSTLKENIIYTIDKLNASDIKGLENTLEKLNLQSKLQKRTKTFIRVVRELAQNAFANALKNNAKLSIQEDKENKCLYIRTSNYFNGGEEYKNNLINTFDSINKSDQKSVKTAYMYKLKNGIVEKDKAFSGAGLGLLDIAKKIKKISNEKIFNYQINETENKGDKKIYKLDLEIKFPTAA